MTMKTNCTAYIDNKLVRGFVQDLLGCGHVGLTTIYDGDDKTIETIKRPYLPYLIILDKDVSAIETVVGGVNGQPITTIEIPIERFEWRDPNLKCNCGSIDYTPEGHGFYHCNMCDTKFVEV